ncbi:MAG TPA: glutamate-cysteine ligase family protein [Gemmatimonadales bacterium]
MSQTLRAALRTDLAEQVFAAQATASRTRRIGAEVELIPFEAATGRRCPLDTGAVTGTLPFLRRFGARQAWTETRTEKGTPCFDLREGGRLSFEPGGQLEYSSPVCRSPSALLALLRAVVLPLRSAAANEGIELLAVGIDPLNSADSAPLLLHSKRYARMAEYLARIGPAGARMMRQTAAFQISLDLDHEPWRRWSVLNAAASYVTAIFANSPLYERSATGFQSTRAQVWRALDPARTGLPWDDRDPVGAYLDFALRAPAILLPRLHGDYRPFGDWLEHARPTMVEWREHLTTLFPEVRPRGHLELRSCDAVPPRWFAAPVALAVGITYDSQALRAAVELLGRPDLGLLDRAGRLGLGDQAIRRTAVDLTEIALAGCQALGPGYFHPSDLEQARCFFDQYTRRGRSPADDLIGNEIAA